MGSARGIPAVLDKTVFKINHLQAQAGLGAHEFLAPHDILLRIRLNFDAGLYTHFSARSTIFFDRISSEGFIVGNDLNQTGPLPDVPTTTE
jgi:hypothetical protein